MGYHSFDLRSLLSPRTSIGFHKRLKITRGRNNRVATVREKVLENEKISRSGKSQGITISVREIKKNEKSHGKDREFQNFPKRC